MKNESPGRAAARVACSARAALAFLASAAAVSPAFAQEPAKTQDAGENLEEVIVTGSHIVRNGDEFPSPVTVVSSDELLLAAPSNIPAALNKLPIFSGQNGQSLGFAPGAISGNYLNLRDFGAARTLILMDGKRVPATSADGRVDANLLPQLLVQRVDVVTGGVSAVYGSDAVTGVVNYVLDNRFEGIKFQTSYGESEHGDFGQTRAGAAFGTVFAGGRGHFVGSVEYFDNPGLLTTDARENTRNVYFTTGSGTAANPYVISRDVRWTVASPNGLVLAVLGPDPDGLGGQVFTPGGGVRPFVHGAATSTPGFESGGDGFYFRKSSVIASLETQHGFARVGFDLTDGLELYAQASASQSKNLGTAFPFTIFPTFVASDNAFLSPAVRTSLQSGGAPGLLLFKSSEDLDGVQADTRARNWQGMVGLNGKLGDSLNFGLSYSRAETKQRLTTRNNINQDRLSAALDAVSSGGQIVCRAAAQFPGCVPLDAFGRGAESAAAVEYVTDDPSSNLSNTLDDATASLSGALFDNWAGTVNFAVSAEYRKASLENVPFTGNYFVASPGAVPKVTQDVTEGAFEVDVPLLKELPGARSLNFNGAVRYADYDSVGGATTWKAGLVWQVTDGLSVRATRSKDFRAPTLLDLYAPSSTMISGFNDLHTGTQPASVIATTTSNPRLDPEISKALTVGLVYKPTSVEDLSFALDFYSFKMANAITVVTPTDLNVQRQCEDSNGTSPLCDLIVRPGPFSDRSPANQATGYFTMPLNAARLETRGVDFEVNYGTSVGSGRLSLRGLAAYQPRYISQTVPGGPTFDVSGAIEGRYQGAVQLPEYRFTGFVDYTTGPVSVDVVQRWRSAVRRSADRSLVFADGRVDSVAYTDLTVTFRMPFAVERSEVFLSVQNLFDKEAPIYTFPGDTLVGWSGSPSLYRDDPIGRYFTAGFRLQF